MLVIDGVKYRLWTPKDEEKELHPMIREHSKEIFGENSLYFDVHHKLRYKLKSKAGIASLPDAYVITLSKPYQWFVVENELSIHPVYSHIVPQLMKFINGIKNSKSQKQIVNLLYTEIIGDTVQKAYVEKMIANPEIYRFLSNVVSDSPRIAIIVEQMTAEIREACAGLPNVQYVEFKTYVREDAENIHAHLFEPIIPAITKKEMEIEEVKAPLEVEERLKRVFPQIKEIFSELRHRIYGLSEKIVEEPRRHVVGYRHSPSHIFFVTFMLQKKKLKIYLHGKIKDYDDPKKYLEFRWRYPEFSIQKMDDLEYSWNLMNQAYKKYGLKKRRGLRNNRRTSLSLRS